MSDINKKIYDQLLSASVVEKNFKINPEQILYEELYPKFGDRFIKYRKKYENYLKDEKHVIEPEYPISVILELVNRCNLECTFCYQGYRNDSTKSTMTQEKLEKIFEEFEKNKLDSLLLSASEPLLYKEFPKVLKLAEQAKIMDQFMFTNGVLLNEKNSEIILNSSLTRLFVSIDALTEKTYDKVRIPVGKSKIGTGRLEQLEKNIRNFIKMRTKLNKKLPLVRVSFIALDNNIHEIKKFLDKWVEIVDTVEVQKESSIKIYDKLLNKNYENKVLLKNYNCNQPWGQVTIHSDGVVSPCCNTIGRNLPIGNIFEKSLKEIWSGDEMNNVRQGFINNKPNKVCKLCIENVKEIY